VSPATKLGDWGAGDQTTLQAVDADEDECDCEDLPDDYPCADCYIAGVRGWPDE
jgi:hypothetical protein